ncbi:hypothetical protein E5D57_010170 [Metarhizium anisopliae]|nr:hypothetical protein E5D57_010170 [Metarhizium anisopliae]
MRFTTFLVSGALAAVAVAQSGTPSAAPPATTSASAPESPADRCLKACAASDVNCKAHCITVPSPNEQNIENTNKCVAACPKGDGSPEQSQKYSDCSQKCIKDNYYASSEGTPNPTGSAGNNGNNGSNGSSASGSDAAPTATGTGAGASPSGTASGTGSSGSQTTGSGSASGTQTGTGASATKTGAAAGLTLGSSGAFVGALAALLAL